MENSIMIVDNKTIKDKIFIVRGQKVMLDSDLAEIYGYNLSAFNQQVKRNIERFDEDFMFQLTKTEFINLKSQIVISKWGGIRKIPYVFTEQGIYMLMTVLKGDLAVKQSKAIIRIFKEMKDYIVASNNIVNYNDFLKLSIATNENTNSIKRLENRVDNLETNTKKELANIMDNFIDTNENQDYLILNGKRVEANLAYSEIYQKAKCSIFIIDNYISLKTLVFLKDIKPNIKVIIFSDNINNGLHDLEFSDFKKEYPNVDIKLKTTLGMYHDRYIIIDYKKDSEVIYHCGSSSKDSGNKITSITKTLDNLMYHSIIDKLLTNKKLVL